MTGFLTLLLATTLAFAGGDLPQRERGEGKAVGPSLRMGSYAALRGGATSAAGLEVSWQLRHSNRLGLDMGVAGSTLQRIDNFNPIRQYATAAVLVDGVYALTPTINVGPSFAMTYRPYQQEWRSVSQTFTPMLGARATAGLLTAPSWQMQLTVKGTVDLIQTQLVFPADIRFLNPFELQIGVRFMLARRRTPQVPPGEG